MKVILQRVSEAAVTVDGNAVGVIGRGLLLLTGFGKDDTEAKLKPMCDKILSMRIFSDENGRFHHSCLEVGGEVLVVPQFTLFADTSKGRRPEFFEAMQPKDARLLFDKFVECVTAATSARVAAGEFGAHMEVESVNDGPVTIIVDN